MKNISLTPIEKMFLDASQGIIENIEAQTWIGRYRVDFFIQNKNLVIELDGHDYHKTKDQRTHDAKRQRSLEINGYRVIRFTGTEIYKDTKRCVQDTINFLKTLPENKTQNTKQELAYCMRMQSLITFLADVHDFDINSEEDYLALILNDNFPSLSIEKTDKNIITVKHYFQLNGDIAFDPLIEFLIIPSPDGEGAEWTPISITQYSAPYIGLPEYRNCINYSDDSITKDTLKILDYDLHREIANLAENWARVLIFQGWAKSHKKPNKSTTDAVIARESQQLTPRRARHA